MKRLKKLAISVGCRFFIAMCLCMFAGVDIIYAQHAESDLSSTYKCNFLGADNKQ